MPFECSMEVQDVFHLSDGRTVFAGTVSGWERKQLIPACIGRLTCAGREFGSFKICGQDSFNPFTAKNPKALSTYDDVSLTSEDVKNRTYTLHLLGDD